MIKSFKIFEKIDNYVRIAKEIQEEFVKAFHSDEDYNNFCVDVENVNNLDEVYWEYIPEDTVNELQLDYEELSHEELIDIMGDVISETNLDDYFEVRGIPYEEWKAKKNSKKYNL